MVYLSMQPWIIWKSVLAPTSEILFFAYPKKSIQKKRYPDAALILRSEGFERGFPKGRPSPYVKRDASLHRPYRANHSVHPCASPFGCYTCKSAVLPICPFKASGARRGITGQKTIPM
jgi:hypothetical protein